jgi:poly(hydroxyalkanoate) granule-associated protein
MTAESVRKRRRMARKRAAAKPPSGSPGNPQAQVLEAFHQIWLAGLGAVSKAQSGSPQLLEDLIIEGAWVHARARGATKRALRGAARRSPNTLDELEKIFQRRVHSALTRLGVPSATEIETLSRRVDVLDANVDRLERKTVPRVRTNAVKKMSAATLPAP